MSTNYVDVLVVGSGFGGAVIAARFGAAAEALGKSVALYEKGFDHSGRLDPRSDGGPFDSAGNRFKHTLGPQYLGTVLDIYSDPIGVYHPGVSSMNVAVGKGLGGGSNVYDGVSLRAPTESFEQLDPNASASLARRRLWPSIYSRASLDPHYATVEAKLRVHRLAWTSAEAPHWQLATKRDYVFAEGCRRIGATAIPLKVATDHDANEGWWNQGQRFEGRQNLTKNYLADAAASGVRIESGCETLSIAPSKKGYVVSGIDRRGGGETPFTVECKLLVIACGSIASSALLLQSKGEFADARSLDPTGALGRYVSANGDYGVSGIVGSKYERDVEGFKGKPMSSFCPSFWAKEKFILIPFYAAPLHLALGQPSTLLRAANPAARGRASTEIQSGEKTFGLGYKSRLRQFGSRMLTMGCLALDECEGEIRVGTSGGTEVRWSRTSDATEARWNAAVGAMARIYESLGGEMYLDGYRKDGTVSTAHPLGGCRMIERAAWNTVAKNGSGVTDELGELLLNPNLFVVDGAIVPSALGTNPSLTIAAVAELVSDRIVRGVGTRSLGDRLA